MNRSIAIALITTVFSSMFVLGEGTIYYVSPSGDDFDEGTLSSPFETVGRGFEAAVSNGTASTVYLLPGEYTDPETLGGGEVLIWGSGVEQTWISGTMTVTGAINLTDLKVSAISAANLPWIILNNAKLLSEPSSANLVGTWLGSGDEIHVRGLAEPTDSMDAVPADWVSNYVYSTAITGLGGTIEGDLLVSNGAIKATGVATTRSEMLIQGNELLGSYENNNFYGGNLSVMAGGLSGSCDNADFSAGTLRISGGSGEGSMQGGNSEAGDLEMSGGSLVGDFMYGNFYGGDVLIHAGSVSNTGASEYLTTYPGNVYISAGRTYGYGATGDGTVRIYDLASPVISSDAANKQYVDSATNAAGADSRAYVDGVAVMNSSGRATNLSVVGLLAMEANIAADFGRDLSISSGIGLEGPGGDLRLEASQGSSDGGNVTIRAGIGFGYIEHGGDVTIAAGWGAAGTGGDILICAATGTYYGGNVTIRSGVGEEFSDGNVTIDASGDGQVVISDVSYPSSPKHAANKAYVDDATNGVVLNITTGNWHVGSTSTARDIVMENDGGLIRAKPGSGNSLRLKADDGNGGQIVLHSPLAMPGLVGQVKNVDTDTDRYAVPNSNCRANSVVMITPVYSDEPGEALPTSYSVEAVNGGFYVRGDSTQWSFNYMIVNP